MIFIKRHWLSLLLVGILCFVLLKSQKQNEELVDQVNDLEQSNEELVKQSNIYLSQIDSFANLDVKIIETIKYIKIKEDEATIAVDTMSVSQLQKFFTERYDK